MAKTSGFRPGFCTHSVIVNDTTLFKHKLFSDKNNLNVRSSNYRLSILPSPPPPPTYSCDSK